MLQVRLQLQEKLDVDLADRKKEVKKFSLDSRFNILLFSLAGRPARNGSNR